MRTSPAIADVRLRTGGRQLPALGSQVGCGYTRAACSIEDPVLSEGGQSLRLPGCLQKRKSQSKDNSNQYERVLTHVRRHPLPPASLQGLRCPSHPLPYPLPPLGVGPATVREVGRGRGRDLEGPGGLCPPPPSD